MAHGVYSLPASFNENAFQVCVDKLLTKFSPHTYDSSHNIPSLFNMLPLKQSLFTLTRNTSLPISSSSLLAASVGCSHISSICRHNIRSVVRRNWNSLHAYHLGINFLKTVRIKWLWWWCVQNWVIASSFLENMKMPFTLSLILKS